MKTTIVANKSSYTRGRFSGKLSQGTENRNDDFISDKGEIRGIGSHMISTIQAARDSIYIVANSRSIIGCNNRE
jgi:hypothetical protein